MYAVCCAIYHNDHLACYGSKGSSTQNWYIHHCQCQASLRMWICREEGNINEKRRGEEETKNKKEGKKIKRKYEEAAKR